MELKALQKLAEDAGVPNREGPVRNWLERIEKVAESLETAINGDVLKKLLATNGFPATESKAMIQAYSKFMQELEDLKMSMLIEFDKM